MECEGYERQNRSEKLMKNSHPQRRAVPYLLPETLPPAPCPMNTVGNPQLHIITSSLTFQQINKDFKRLFVPYFPTAKH